MRAALSLVNRIWQLRARNRLLICAGLGAVAALGQAPVGAWPVTVIAFAMLFAIWTGTASWRQAGWAGWAAGTGYFMLALSWIVEPFLVDVARHGWIAPLALIGLSSGLALFWAAAFGVSRAIGGKSTAWAVCFVLAEAARSYILTGFPWAQVGHVWINTPILQLAAFIGSLGLSLLLVMAAVAVWHLVSGNRVLGAVTVVAMAALWLGSVVMTPPVDLPSDAPVVRLIQPNAPQHEKWDPAKMQGFFDRQIEFTSAGDTRPDLIVWPETAVPVTLNYAGPTLEVIAKAAGNVPVVLGLRRLEQNRIFNSMVLLDEEGLIASTYDKHHLVPFGEYIPFGDYLSRFGIRGMAAGDGNGFSPGPGTQVINMGRLGRALPLICYEGVFAQDVASAPERADFLLLITNDAWFGKVSGPYQHLAQARLRSVEQGLPMIRAANTGVSAMIDPRGRVTAHLPLGQAGWLDAVLPPPLAPTFYVWMGDLPIVVLLLAMLGLTLIYNRKSR